MWGQVCTYMKLESTNEPIKETISENNEVEGK